MGQMTTRAGDVVIQVRQGTPSVLVVGRVSKDGDKYGSDPQIVTDMRQAKEKAKELVIDGGTVYRYENDSNWGEVPI